MHFVRICFNRLPHTHTHNCVQNKRFSLFFFALSLLILFQRQSFSMCSCVVSPVFFLFLFIQTFLRNMASEWSFLAIQIFDVLVLTHPTHSQRNQLKRDSKQHQQRQKQISLSLSLWLPLAKNCVYSNSSEWPNQVLFVTHKFCAA